MRAVITMSMRDHAAATALGKVGKFQHDGR